VPRKQRAAVFQIDLDFEPSPVSETGLEGLRICLLPLLNSNDLYGHLERPYTSYKKEKVLSRLDPADHVRVVGLALMQRIQKRRPAIGVLTTKPFELLLFETLVKELEALGLIVIPPPDSSGSQSTGTEAIVETVKRMPGDERVDYVLTGEIIDFFSTLYPKGNS